MFADLTFDNVSELAQTVMDGFRDKKWDKVELLYNEFKNVVVQNKKVETLLPIEGIASSEKNKAFFCCVVLAIGRKITPTQCI